jgi:hypothetical protein
VSTSIGRSRFHAAVHRKGTTAPLERNPRKRKERQEEEEEEGEKGAPRSHSGTQDDERALFSEESGEEDRGGNVSKRQSRHRSPVATPFSTLTRRC